MRPLFTNCPSGWFEPLPISALPRANPLIPCPFSPGGEKGFLP